MHVGIHIVVVLYLHFAYIVCKNHDKYISGLENGLVPLTYNKIKLGFALSCKVAILEILVFLRTVMIYTHTMTVI